MQWKAIDTNSEYEVSDTGLIRKNGIILQTYDDKDGYQFIPLIIDGKKTTRRIHRLVLQAFNPNLNYKNLEVHHKDENVKNNNLNNLEWVTHEENVRYIDPNKLQSETQFIARPVAQYSLCGAFINSFPSAYQACKLTGCNHRHISEVCKGKRKTCGGFIWKYFEGSTTNSSNKCCETEDSTNVDEDIV